MHHFGYELYRMIRFAYPIKLMMLKRVIKLMMLKRVIGFIHVCFFHHMALFDPTDVLVSYTVSYYKDALYDSGMMWYCCQLTRIWISYMTYIQIIQIDVWIKAIELTAWMLAWYNAIIFLEIFQHVIAIFDANGPSYFRSYEGYIFRLKVLHLSWHSLYMLVLSKFESFSVPSSSSFFWLFLFSISAEVAEEEEVLLKLASVVIRHMLTCISCKLFLRSLLCRV